MKAVSSYQPLQAISRSKLPAVSSYQPFQVVGNSREPPAAATARF
jgi:hypothetical protein